MSEDRAPEAKKSATFIVHLGNVSPDQPPGAIWPNTFRSIAMLPRNTYVCADGMGFINIISDLAQPPEKIDSGMNYSIVQAFEGNQIIVSGNSRETYRRAAFLFDIISKEKKALDGERFNQASFIKFKSGSKEYLAIYGGMYPIEMEVRGIEDLDKALSHHETPRFQDERHRLIKHAVISTVAAVGDKVVVSFAKEGLGVWSVGAKGDLVYEGTPYFGKTSLTLESVIFAYGSQDYLVLLQSGLSVCKLNPATSQFDLISESKIPDGINKTNCKFFPNSSIFVFIHPDGKQITIQDCQTGDKVTATLPVACYKDLELSADGRITYITKEGAMVALRGQFLLGKQLKAVVQVLSEPGRLTRDPATIVAGYMDVPLLELPILKMADIEAAAAACPQGESKDKTAYGPMFSATDQSANAHLALIEKLRAAENDADRFVVAQEFMQANPEHVFTKELDVRMNKIAAAVTSKPG